MGYADITKKYAEVEHSCDSCENNIVHVWIGPDVITLDAGSKKMSVAADPLYTYTCKIGLNNTPKVIACNQYSRMRSRR